MQASAPQRARVVPVCACVCACVNPRAQMRTHARMRVGVQCVWQGDRDGERPPFSPQLFDNPVADSRHAFFLVWFFFCPFVCLVVCFPAGLSVQPCRRGTTLQVQPQRGRQSKTTLCRIREPVPGGTPNAHARARTHAQTRAHADKRAP
jgi:hypothetical protein